MRKIIFISIFTILFTSCSKTEYRKSLIEADSIASVNPQKAIAMLNSMKKEIADAPEYEQMYYRLLWIKVTVKTNTTQESDSSILKLVRYYEKKGSKELLPKAYYYAGRTYQNLNDAPQALEYYHKAMDVTPENDLRMKSLLCFNSGRLFLNQALYDQALSMYKNALIYDTQLNDSLNIIDTFRDLAYTYNKLNIKDSSFYYYKKAYKLSQETNNPQPQMTVLAQMASFYIENKDYAKAKECLQPELNSHSEIQLSPNYTMALKICMNTSQYDSAHYYAQELLKVGTIYAKQIASRYLTELALKEKKYNDADKYLKLFNLYTDSVKIITATESVNRMNAIYNYNLREKENLTLKAENANKRLSLTVATFIVFILLVIFITYIYINRQRQKRQTERLKELRKSLFEQSKEYISQNKEKIKILEQELERTSKENLTLIERIKQQRADLILANENARRKQEKNESSKTRIAATDIYQTIQTHIKKEKVINIKEWDILEEVINSEVTDFKDNLYGYHNISQHEYHICMLIRLGISPKDMGILLGCTTSAVSKVRKRLHEKFFSNEGTPKEFDDFISHL